MGVEVSRLSNGLTVATETLPSIESVALGVWVKSGARNERDDEHGMAHLLEHMAFKGTKRRSAFQIASEIENVGGEINAATSVETTSFYARSKRVNGATCNIICIVNSYFHNCPIKNRPKLI